MESPIVNEIQVKSVLSKSNLPVCEYSVNPYVGCTHACKYCYASFMKRFTNHLEPWGDFLDVKYWAEIKNPQKYAGKELFIGSVTDPYNPQEKIRQLDWCISAIPVGKAEKDSQGAPARSKYSCGNRQHLFR